MKKRNRKCTICGGTHKPAKCPVKARTASPKAVAQVFGEVVQREEMSLLERILLLDRIKYSPSHCAKCGHQNPEHLEMECPMYEQCLTCYCWGSLVVQQVMSAEELTLTIMRKNGTRAVTRQSRDDFVPGRGIML